MAAQSASEAHATHTAPAAHTAPSTQAAPESAPLVPLAEARRRLEEGRDLMARARDALRGSSGIEHASELVGQASTRVASALYFLRQVTRG